MYYGKYKGIVEDISDPEQRGRVRLKCPEVLGDQLSGWALPCFAPNTFSVPSRGTLVWVEFESGKRDSPIWTGVFYTRAQWMEKFGMAYDPNKLVTKSVGTLQLTSVSGGITVSSIGNNVSINTTTDTGLTRVDKLEYNSLIQR